MSVLLVMVNTSESEINKTDTTNCDTVEETKSIDKIVTQTNMANDNGAVASGDGDAVASDISSRSKEYKHLIDYGLDIKVANRLDDIFKTGQCDCTIEGHLQSIPK